MQVCILNGGASTLRMQGLLSTAGPATMAKMTQQRRAAGRSSSNAAATSASASAAAAAAAAATVVPSPRRIEVPRMDDAPPIYGGSYYDDI